MTERAKHIFIFIVLLTCGSYLRLYNLDNSLLWQDEAETAWYARQMLDFRLPNAYDAKRDLFLYIGALVPISAPDSATGLIDTDIYEFAEEDFADDGTLIKHPYGDIIVTALSFLIFGPSTFSARFLFALMGVFSLALTFQLGKYLYNSRTGLISMAFQTFNIVLIAYERQARYYSLAVFCFLGALCFGLKAIEKNKTRHYIFAALFSTGLICGNPITAIVLFITISVYSTCTHGNVRWALNKKLLLTLMALTVFTLLYCLVYQPWRSWHITPVQYSFFLKFVKVALFTVRFSIDCSFILVCLGAATLLFYRKREDMLVIMIVLIFLTVYPCFVFYSSLFERLMIVIIPFISITAARFLDEFYLILRKKGVQKFIAGAAFNVVLFSGLIIPSIFSFPADIIGRDVQTLQRDIPSGIPLAYYLKYINGREPEDFLLKGTVNPQWVKEAVEFLKSRDVGADEWVFTTYSNTVFLFYSDFKVQLIWPVKKSFLDSCQERFWILIAPFDHEATVCHWFYKFSGSMDRCRNRNYYDIIKKAEKHTLLSGAVIYECNSATEKSNNELQ